MLPNRVEGAGEGQALTLELPPGLQRVEGAETQPVAEGADGNGTVLWKARVLQSGTHTLRVRTSHGTVYTRTLTITPADGK